jgi:hypothetical protein
MTEETLSNTDKKVGLTIKQIATERLSKDRITAKPTIKGGKVIRRDH